MPKRIGVDYPLLLSTLMLCALGVLSIYSASAGETGGTPYANKQAAWVGLGLLVMLLAVAVDYHTWADLSPFIYAVGVLLLVVLLIKGDAISGARSWLKLGPLRLQPSEFMKVATCLLLARVFARHQDKSAGPSAIIVAALVAGLPLALVARQPDLGTALTFAGLFAGVLFVIGLTRGTVVLLSLASAVSGVALWQFGLRAYHKERILTFLRPETAPLDAGYQTLQSKIAIGAGGLYGKGFGLGSQSQLDFLPEKHTDLIFSVFAEEWGFIGCLVMLGLYGVLLLGLLSAASESRDRLGVYLAVGIMAVITSHIVVNLGMVTGIMPTIGIPLPLMSYGGSSVISTLFAIGLAMNVKVRRFANH